MTAASIAAAPIVIAVQGFYKTDSLLGFVLLHDNLEKESMYSSIVSGRSAPSIENVAAVSAAQRVKLRNQSDGSGALFGSQFDAFALEDA